MSTQPPDQPQQPGPGQPGGYGAPPPGYGGPPPPGAGEPGYGAPAGYGPGGPAGPPAGALADYGARLIAGAVDYLAPTVVIYILLAISQPLGRLGQLVGLAYVLYSKYLEGQTGQGFGKQVAKIKLIGEQTGQPVGAGLAIGRYFVHIIDSIPCLLGFLWPIWDAKKQTFADKILKTVVVRA